jgi:hypothetical protein
VNLRTEPVRVANGSDEDGVLVFTGDDRLAAIVTRLSERHDDLAGLWFLEVGFGPVDGPSHPTFSSIDAALDWISQRLRSRAASKSLLA